MVDELMGAYGGRLVIAVGGVAAALFLLVFVLWLIRRRSGPSPFIRGGKNRQPRLQVLDAAAVDARRRIVLVRRDDVEHLVMIGGPTDIVIESGIQPRDPQPGAAQPVTAPRSREQNPAPPEPRLEAAPQPAAIAAPARQPAALPHPSAAPLPVTQREADEPRPEPRISRPVAAASVSPRQVAVSREDDVSPVQPLERPVASAPAPSVAAAAPVQAPVVERPSASPAPAETLATTRQDVELGAATDALDAARRRVFQPAAAAAPPTAPAATIPARPAPALITERPQRIEPPAPEPRPLGSDFERILEEEMANNLAASRVPASGTPSFPPRDPSQPRVTGATPEPSLQSEVARIFGEMSVTRNER